MEKSRDIIAVIAGGPSARGFNFENLSEKAFLIGVNDSCKHAPCNMGVSMDGRWMSHRYDFLASVNYPFIASERHFNKWCGRRGPWPALKTILVDPDKPKMSESWETLYANNSGFLGLSVAYLMRPKQVYLFGFDHTMQPGYGQHAEHWFGGYEWRSQKKAIVQEPIWSPPHSHAARQFIAAGIQVFNVSPISRLRVYPKLSPNDVMTRIASV